MLISVLNVLLANINIMQWESNLENQRVEYLILTGIAIPSSTAALSVTLSSVTTTTTAIPIGNYTKF
jgi:hypothetical protein